MNRTLRLQVRLMRLFRRVERTEKAVRAVQTDGRAKLVSVRDDTKKASLAIAAGPSLILQIGGSRNITKIPEGIVGPVAIEVIDVINRPFAGDVQPCQAVLCKVPAIDADRSIAKRVAGPRYVSDMGPIARANSASEHTGFRIVVEQFAQTLSRQLFQALSLHFTRISQ